jgi:hypothetical protein
MMTSLGEALPGAIVKVTEFIMKQEAEANELDKLMKGCGDGNRLIANVLRQKRDAALLAQQSGDVVAMIAAYQLLKPALELATLPEGD